MTLGIFTAPLDALTTTTLGSAGSTQQRERTHKQQSSSFSLGCSASCHFSLQECEQQLGSASLWLKSLTTAPNWEGCHQGYANVDKQLVRMKWTGGEGEGTVSFFFFFFRADMFGIQRKPGQSCRLGWGWSGTDTMCTPYPWYDTKPKAGLPVRGPHANECSLSELEAMT